MGEVILCLLQVLDREQKSTLVQMEHNHDKMANNHYNVRTQGKGSIDYFTHIRYHVGMDR